MGPVGKAVAFGCAQALKWILWLAGGLLLILVIVQYVRGDVTANAQANLMVMAGFLVAGYICHAAGQKIAQM